MSEPGKYAVEVAKWIKLAPSSPISELCVEQVVQDAIDASSTEKNKHIEELRSALELAWNRHGLILERNSALVALLDRVPHVRNVFRVFDCADDCPRCAWEALKKKEA